MAKQMAIQTFFCKGTKRHSSKIKVWRLRGAHGNNSVFKILVVFLCACSVTFHKAEDTVADVKVFSDLVSHSPNDLNTEQMYVQHQLSFGFL